MKNIRKLRKKAGKKEKKIKLSKMEKKGSISRKRRMKYEIWFVFLIAAFLIRKDWMDSV